MTADDLLELRDPEEDYGPRHSRRRRIVALVVVLFLLAISAMATGFSLFWAPPTPERTRPLPVVLPEQGAVR